MADRPQRVAAGVDRFAARTPTLPPATTTNSYALGEREVLLVEPATPYEDERRAWVEWVRGLASQGRSPTAIFVTHHHPDHVGGAAFLSRELDLPLWGHAETDARLEVAFARHLADGDELVLDGPSPQRWRCLHTPGHDWGHLCLHEPNLGALVVGDMVASEGTILIAPGDGDLVLYLEQLERLEALEGALALPAHGDPIDAPSKLFRHYIEHRLMREAKVEGALRPTALDLDALVVRVYDDVPPQVHPIAKLSLEAHLDKLIHEGRAARTEAGYRGATAGE